MCFWFGTRGLQHVMSILSCSLLVPSSKKVNPKMLNYCRDMMALSLFHVLLPPISANCSGFSHRLLLPQKDMHSMTKQHVFSFSRFFSCTHPIFSICHSIAQFTHAQLWTEYISGVQSHSPYTTMHILLCQHDFHITTMFQEYESRTSL